jgi:polar amino acid transport system substrate-binding protein
MAEEGEVDGIFTVVRVPEREKFFFLTEPVVDSAYTLFAIDSSTFVYRQPKDLEGFTVSVNDQSGTARVLEETVKGLRNVSIAGEAQHLIALRKLSHGRYPGNALAFVNREVALQLAKDDGITNLKPVGDVRKIQYHIGFSRKKVNDATFTQFNDALRAQIKEGKVKGILDKYGMKRSD